MRGSPVSGLPVKGLAVNRSAPLVGLAVAACALLAACGSSTNKPSADGGSVPAASPTVAASVPAPTTAAPATAVPQVTVTETVTGPVIGPTGPSCTAAGLTVSKSTSDGAAGTLVQRFILTNTGAGPCEMSGNPFISPYGLLTQGSTKVEATLNEVKVNPIPSDFGDLGAIGGTIGLAPGDTAVFYFKWSQVPVGNTKCPKADGFDFQPPGDPSSDDQKLVTFAFSPCGGELEVSQVLPPSVGS